MEHDDVIVLDPRAPLDIARNFLRLRHTAKDIPTLVHHRGDFYIWSGSHYAAVDGDEMRSRLYAFLDAALRPAGRGKSEPFRPTRAKVGDVLDALAAAANLPAGVDPPAWLDSASTLAKKVPPGEIVAVANGLLHLPRRVLLPHTPAFFGHVGLEFPYDRKAPAPTRWLRFLNDLWPGDPGSQETLQDIFGYLLTQDTRQQKLFLVVGPKRSGKGTMARILTGLLGQRNVVSPTLAGLAHQFGLAPLIGKPLAIIADARLGGRVDAQIITERLLSISGEDGVTVDRKYQSAWTGRLPTRFLVLSNELPRLSDASGALASRFVVLVIRQTFYGREDPGLTGALLAELPGILNWALDGWQRLAARGYFVQPRASADAIQELEDLGSPIGAFLRDRCTVGAGLEVESSALFDAWREWCRAQGRDHPGTVQSFGRDLRAAVPQLDTRQRRDLAGGRARVFIGISLS